MALEIGFSKFDTVCYSSQHNIIQLINSAVGISIQVDLNTGSIEQVQAQVQEVSEKADEGHDAMLLAQNLNERLSTLESKFNQMWNDTNTFRTKSDLGMFIDNLEDRVIALEDET